MNILVAVEELRIGGAQTFALRLAQALHNAGHRVYLYNMYWQFTEHDLVKRLAPDVELLQYKPASQPMDAFLMRAEGWLERRGQQFALRNGILRKHLNQVIKEKSIDIIHSHTFKCDHLITQVLRQIPRIAHVITMHGDYEQFLKFYRLGTAYVIPNYLQKLSEVLSRVNGIAYLSTQNLEVLQPDVTAVSTGHIRLRRIYNGLDAQISEEANLFTRKALEIPAEALVFGMVARGVPEKGWEPLVQAYQQVKAEATQPVHLVLVGSSAFLDSLREKYKADGNIHFLGFVNNPVDCVESFDVGVLASSLKESLPNSIAEYLFCKKPVISTTVGEIQQMITTPDGQEAGLLIEFPEYGLADGQQLYEAMAQYAGNKALLRQHQQLASQAFTKFDMKRCVQAYTELYQACQPEL
ncbi:glycosyltransferase family 4 protein [Hymenobacter terricola]|uniref:glycosyltransferase family 4 protein n=1 Tax=Hymenobacter terricola TaxID=2819236 RepID=UPI001B312192|nr:glycosyltransferase family 4 protein [Hymenobacter terricola]